jgi:hypothetical protein
MAGGTRRAGTAPSQAGRVAILAGVTRPIALFALSLIVTEGALGTVALRCGSNGQEVLSIAALVFVLVILVVAAMAVWAPGQLMGNDWLREPLAESLAEAIVIGLKGNVTNLPSTEDQISVWVDLILWIERRRRQEGIPEREFRAFLVRGIQDRVVNKSPDLRAAIEAELKIGRAPDRFEG